MPDDRENLGSNNFMEFKIPAATLKLKIAYIISRFFDIVFWALPFSAIAVFSSHFSGYNRIVWIIGLLLFAGFLPFSIFWFWLKKGKISDVDFTKKEERTPTILIILFFWSLTLALTWVLSGSRLILVILSSAIIIGTLVLIINLRWKISNHTLAATIAGFLINFLYGWSYWWLFIFVPLVFWSRLVLKKHTFWQLVAGSILGCLFFIFIKLFGH